MPLHIYNSGFFNRFKINLPQSTRGGAREIHKSPGAEVGEGIKIGLTVAKKAKKKQTKIINIVV